jgi:hypothetical protein
MTARELIASSLRLLEVIGAGETVDANDEAACLEAWNGWIDAQNLNPLALYAIIRRTFNLAADTADYTIGDGATWDLGWRPQAIESAGIILDPGADQPVEIPLGPGMMRAEYQSIAIKDLSSTYPTRWYYNQDITAAGYGTISVYPQPDSATPDFVVYTRKHLAEFENADLVHELVFPPGYRRMFRYNLAVEVADEFGVIPSPTVTRTAVKSLADVQKANWKPTELRFPKLFGTRSRFNVHTGA